ncbi:MAG: amidophosphoribosyltransferase [Rikenellaceae bacterium]|jgi:amidophosphoribosyltransferase|nr:amidophosphoribosyltransferase [Rikenellaceae bacterium]
MSGFFGAVSKNDCVADVFYGTDYHSHLGTKKAGMAFFDGKSIARSIHNLESAYFRNKFEGDLPKFEGSKIGIGIISDAESQPVTLTSHLGRFAVITIGRIDNIRELSDELLQKRINFAELSGGQINPTELVGILISSADSFAEGIKLVQDKIKGSCSLMVLTYDGIYVARDKYGRTPIVIGRCEEGHVVASESSSFINLGYRFDRELGPGQAFFLTAEGAAEVLPARAQKQICSFMWVYYGYPSSCYEGVNVEAARYRCGARIAAREKDFAADFVCGIPDSGIGHAVGYSNESGKPYVRAIVKYTPSWPRSFMPQNQSMRDLVAKMKLIPNEAFTHGARMLLLDDSIVRGTQLKDNICKLMEAGAREIHIRVACPPLVYPCPFLNFSTSRSMFDLYTRRVIRDLEGTETFTDELLAEYADQGSEKYNRMVEVIRKTIGADTLKFQRLDDLVDAIGLPKDQLCTHCWDNSSGKTLE